MTAPAYLIVHSPTAAAWKLFPSGDVADATEAKPVKSVLDALTPTIPATVSHLSDRQTYDVYMIDKCRTCSGKMFVECECVYEIQRGDPDGEYDSCIGRYYGNPLRRGQFVESGVWDCDDCDVEGFETRLVGEGIQRDRLMDLFEAVS